MKKLTRILCSLIALALTFSCAALAGVPTHDRSGSEIAIPEEVNRIVSLAPATTQVLEALGVMDRVVAVDTQTPAYVEGVDDLPQFDMMAPDIERIAQLRPDIVYTSGMSYIEGDPFQALTEMGVCVVDIPSSASIADVKLDIIFTAACLGMEAEGAVIADEMQSRIDALAAVGANITEKKTVLFEISALPYIYSFGSGTFLHEMIELLGAENVFADQSGWISVTEESAVAADPDVILTSVNYIEDPVGEILGRQGWSNVAAVAGKDVYYISNGASSLPNQYIVDAMTEMALAIYPEAYEAFAGE